MTDVEKIYAVLELIYEKSKQIAPGEPIAISITRLVRSGMDRFDVNDIMSLLAQDERRHCINIVKYPDLEKFIKNPDDDFYWVTPQEANFLTMYRHYQSAMEYPKNRTEVKVSAAAKVKIEPGSYDAANGILIFNGHRIQIVRQAGRKGKDETHEARLMRLLFKDVNTLMNGVPMRRVVSVGATSFDTKKRKLVKNYVAEINKKVSQSIGSKKTIELIVYNQQALMVNSLYL